MHRQRITGLVENGAQACAGIWPKDIVLGVLFARADELDWTANCFRRLNGLHDIIGNDLPAETAAEERHMYCHRLGRAAYRLSHRLLASRDRLDGAPDLHGAVSVVRGRVDWLERRMCDVREYEVPLYHRGRLVTQNLPRRTDVDDRDSLVAVECGLQQGVDFRGRKAALRAAVEHDIQGVERPLGLPEMIGDHADRVIARQGYEPWMFGGGLFVCHGDRCDPHYRVDARHLENFGFVSDCTTAPVKEGAIRIAAFSMSGTLTSIPKRRAACRLGP